MPVSSSLTEFYRRKAENELGENETKKAQSLEQFRDWMKKQAHIKNCRQDDIYLLGYLRCRKYSFLNATKTLENYLVTMKMLPHYFENLDIEDPDLKALVASGYFLILPNRTKNGERIVLVRPQVFDLNKFVGNHSIRICTLGFHSVFEEEETQISGVKIYVDYANTPLNFLGLFKISDHKNIADMFKLAFPLRLKSFNFLNIPGYVNSVLQIFVSFLNEKIKNRVRFIKNSDDLKSEFDDDLLPEEYGGKIPISKIIEYTKEILMKHRSAVLEIAKTEVVIDNYERDDINKCTEIDAGIVGNFRKLEID